MMSGRFGKVFCLLMVILAVSAPVASAQLADEQGPIVRAVLFFSPSCGHCHNVIETVLLPMIEANGDRLQVLGVNTTEESGSELYQVAIDRFKISDERRGVPTLIIADTVLVGSGEIPEKFPGLVEDAFAAGGLDWPDIPGLAELIATSDKAAEQASTAQAAEAAEQPVAVAEATAEPVEQSAVAEATAQPPVPTQPAVSLEEAFEEAVSAPAPPADPVGMAIAWVVLGAMIVSVGIVLWRLLTGGVMQFGSTQARLSWIVPVLALAGIVVASYLAYVEISQTEAVCGPIGECNLVQASPYAKLFGVPIAVWGLLNYAGVIGLWVLQKIGKPQIAQLSLQGLAALTIFGVFFSIYLTLLEIFVILAVCMWCLGSAVITTLLMGYITFAAIRSASAPQQLESVAA